MKVTLERKQLIQSSWAIWMSIKWNSLSKYKDIENTEQFKISVQNNA